MTPDEFFADKALPKELFLVVRREVEAIGETGIRVTKSQIAFRRRRNFAWFGCLDSTLKAALHRLPSPFPCPIEMR